MTTLNNGLRIVTDAAPSVETLAMGVWVGVGTRHEDAHENGIAHMVEHMMFKGTRTRTAKQISDEIEDAGGHHNAYTGKEITAYYIKSLNDHLDLNIDILADMVQNSTFPEEEIERESGVIQQEIKMYEDSPDDMVFEYALKHAYPDQSIGASGLGTPEIVAGIGKDHLNRYIGTHYAPNRTLISAAGDLDHGSFVKKIEKAFDHLPAENRKNANTWFVTANYTPSAAIHEKDIEQAHLVMGFKGVSRLDPRYPAQRLLSNILGGGSSSRLYQEIREKHGLVYSIYTFQDSYQDTSLFGLYAGTGPDELEQLVPLAIEQILDIKSNITEQELTRAKTQITSSIRMSREKMMTRADQQGRYVMAHGEPFTVAEFVDKINAVTADDITKLATEIFASDLLVSAYGPVGKLMPVANMKEKLAA